MPYYNWAKILRNRKIGEDSRGQDIYRMKLESPWIAQKARPGQFITIVCYGGTFLRRPFSIAYTGKRRFLYILYKVVGNGTRWLSQTPKGTDLDILGALGKKPFVIYPEIKKPILVAGGMGIAPLIFLCKQLLLSTINCHPLFLIGADNKSAIITPPIKNRRVEVITSTSDGSLGYHGNITEILDGAISENTVIYTAGPPAMLQEVARISQKHNVPCQVSLEATMACAIGACLGCAVETFLEGYDCHQRVCSDGPIFNAKIINWDSYIRMHR